MRHSPSSQSSRSLTMSQSNDPMSAAVRASSKRAWSTPGTRRLATWRRTGVVEGHRRARYARQGRVTVTLADAGERTAHGWSGRRPVTGNLGVTSPGGSRHRSRGRVAREVVHVSLSDTEAPAARCAAHTMRGPRLSGATFTHAVQPPTPYGVLCSPVCSPLIPGQSSRSNPLVAARPVALPIAAAPAATPRAATAHRAHRRPARQTASSRPGSPRQQPRHRSRRPPSPSSASRRRS